MKKIGFIKACLVMSLLFNLVGLGLGTAYANYVGLSIPYAISRIPRILNSLSPVIPDVIPEEDIPLKEIISISGLPLYLRVYQYLTKNRGLLSNLGVSRVMPLLAG